jgi:hypothetical protein
VASKAIHTHPPNLKWMSHLPLPLRNSPFHHIKTRDQHRLFPIFKLVPQKNLYFQIFFGLSTSSRGLNLFIKIQFLGDGRICSWPILQPESVGEMGSCLFWHFPGEYLQVKFSTWKIWFQVSSRVFLLSILWCSQEWQRISEFFFQIPQVVALARILNMATVLVD